MKILKIIIISIFVFAGLFTLSLQKLQTSAQTNEFRWDLPKGFPVPLVPKDNPMTDEKVELGRHLFYDVRLSINEKTSCATCQLQSKAFIEDKT